VSGSGLSRHRFAVGAGIAISLALLAWTFRDVSFRAVWAHVREADPVWLAAMVVTATFGFVLRAMRWRLLLAPVYPATRFDSRFGAVCIGFMANNVLPARLGEFARAFAVSRIEPVRAGAALGTLVVERLLDGLVLASVLALCLMLPGSPIASPLVRNIAALGAAIFFAGWLLLGFLAREPERWVGLFDRSVGRLLPPRAKRRLSGVLSAFVEGLAVLHDGPIFLRTLVWTLVLWLVLAASVWFGLLAFAIESPGLVGALLLQSLIGFAVAIPSSPGFFGPFEAACRLGLDLYGVGAARTVGFAVTYHVLTFLPVTLLGLWYLHRMGMQWRQLQRSEEILETGDRSA